MYAVLIEWTSDIATGTDRWEALFGGPDPRPLMLNSVE